MAQERRDRDMGESEFENGMKRILRVSHKSPSPVTGRSMDSG